MPVTNADFLAAVGGITGTADDLPQFRSADKSFRKSELTRTSGNPAPLGPAPYTVIGIMQKTIISGVNAGKYMDDYGNPADGTTVVTDPRTSMNWYILQNEQGQLFTYIHSSDLLTAADAEAYQLTQTPNQWDGQ